MAELLIRVSSQDAALMNRVFGLDGARAAAWRPHRLVVDAHVAAKTPALADIARRAGVPFLVDPQTYFLQGTQHSGDPWAKLPFGDPRPLTAADLANTATQDALVAACIDYQIAAGATAIIAPYLHLERLDDGLVFVQAALWRRTAALLAARGNQLPVIAVVALGWRLLDPSVAKDLIPAWEALDALHPTEVAIAATKAHMGSTAVDRLHHLVMLITKLTSAYPVLAWQQGLLGEACVAAGARGYETGIAMREHCDLQTARNSHRAAPTSGGGAPPVYIPALGRGIPKRNVKEIRADGTVWSSVLCADPRCCPSGDHVLNDARQHAIVSRARSLAELSEIDRATWRWAEVSRRSAQGIRLGQRINKIADRTPGMARVDTRALEAIHTVSDQRRHLRKRRTAA